MAYRSTEKEVERMSNDDVVYTYDEAAGRLRLSRATVARLVRDKRIPVVRLGRRVLFRRKALEALIENAEEGSK